MMQGYSKTIRKPFVYLYYASQLLKWNEPCRWSVLRKEWNMQLIIQFQIGGAVETFLRCIIIPTSHNTWNENYKFTASRLYSSDLGEQLGF